VAGQGGPGGTAGGARAAAGVVRRHVWISGRVQGVWFRESCRRRAAELGVGGWIRNRADGRVEAVVEGDVAAVDAMVEFCRTGPPRAEVTGIEVVDERPIGETNFLVQ
jgi:acylphosphatase